MLEPAAGKSSVDILIVLQSSFSFFPGDTVPDERHYHQQQEYDGERRNTHEADPFTTEHVTHGPAQAFCNKVHAGNDEQGHEEGEGETEYDGPAQRLPEYHIITSEEDMRIEFGKQRDEVDVEACGDGNESEYRRQRGQ